MRCVRRKPASWVFRSSIGSASKIQSKRCCSPLGSVSRSFYTHTITPSPIGTLSLRRWSSSTGTPNQYGRTLKLWSDTTTSCDRLRRSWRWRRSQTTLRSPYPLIVRRSSFCDAARTWPNVDRRLTPAITLLNHLGARRRRSAPH